jgi:isopenicillin-N epimerase
VAGIILAGLGPRTKLVILEHVTSPTAATFPVAAVVEGCRENGVPILVDAAHVPGMVEVDLEALRPDFWTGNFHKWACAPKGSAVLYVSEPWRARIHPLVTSHGYGGSFHEEFDWTGTADPTPYLTIPAALDFMASLGWDRVRSHNHALAGYGRTILAAALGTEPQVPEDAFGSMAVVALPPGSGASREDAMAIQARLYEAARVEVPMTCWNDRGYVRLSAQAYNAPSEFERLASALPMAIHPAAAG